MFYKHFKKLDYKKLFLYGSYNTIILLAILGTILDFSIGNKDYYLDIIYAILVYLAYIYVCKRKENLELAAFLLFWISAFTEFAFIYLNRVDCSLMYSFMIPIIAYISMQKRSIFFNLLAYYLILIVLLFYFYIKIPNHFLLHNKSYMFEYIILNIFIIAFGFFYHFAVEEFIRRLQIANQKNTLLLKEVHHRVKNNLNLMASILGLQEQQNSNSVVKNALSESRSRIESMAILHEVLYKSDSANYLDLKLYIQKLISAIIKSETNAKRVDILTKIESIELDMTNLIEFGIMLNEMLTNTIKHNKNSKIIIDIEFKKVDDGYILIYCDNSKNVDINRLEKGFGFNLIKLSVAQFKGKMSISTQKGLCYTIEFKELF